MIASIRSFTAAAFVLAAINTGSAFAAGPSHAYTCSGGTKLTATFSDPNVTPGSVVLVFSDAGEITLPQVMSADGGRYEADNLEFWIKGKGATLNKNGQTETCHTD